MTRILRVATTNTHKLREIGEMLAPRGYSVRGVDDLPGFHVDEDGATFAANAVKKARALLALTGETAIADDSGIVVDALAGAPGIHSARYAGVTGAAQDEANRAKLLGALAEVPDAERTARFVCVIALARAGGPPLTFEGTLEGTIARNARGHGGFGYDPLFVPRGDSRTVAELTPAEKHAVSHRGAALRQLVEHLAHERTATP